MKRTYEKPMLECERFVANEYVSACYTLTCDVPSGGTSENAALYSPSNGCGKTTECIPEDQLTTATWYYVNRSGPWAYLAEDAEDATTVEGTGSASADTTDAWWGPTVSSMTTYHWSTGNRTTDQHYSTTKTYHCNHS